jgi:large subunit ribosomal protein L15
MRDILKKLPKLRGHGKNRARTVRAKRHEYEPINLATLEAAFDAGDIVNPETLFKKGLIRARGGKLSYVKILGTGSLTKKLAVTNCSASAIAKGAIEAAGGSVLS